MGGLWPRHAYAPTRLWMIYRFCDLLLRARPGHSYANKY